MKIFNFKDILMELINNETEPINSKELAIKTKVPKSSISHYLLGETKIPTLSNAVKIANYFNVSLNYLFDRSDNKEIDIFAKANKHNFYETYLFLLKENKTNNYKLSNIIGINKDTVHFWKIGKLPSITTLIKLADYFGVSIDYLINGHK